MKALSLLYNAPIHWFEAWPIRDVPQLGAVVYTIWGRDGKFLYVGMAGRGTTSPNGRGPFGRLNSHASGRRSGDQFCIYVADRIILPLVHNRISEIAEGILSLDKLTREYIRAELGFRFIQVDDSTQALTLERQVQRGEWEHGRPLLNPIRERSLTSCR